MQQISKPRIIKAVKKMTDSAGSSNPTEICHYYNIDIHYHNLQQKLKGYFFYQSRIANIVIDENIIEIFRQVLIAHELGHFALHKGIAMMKGFQELEVLEKRDSSSMETEANLFAAELLINDRDVISSLKDYTFFETAQILGVPAALLDFKFSMLQSKGVFDSWPAMAKADFLKGDIGAYDEKNNQYYMT